MMLTKPPWETTAADTTSPLLDATENLDGDLTTGYEGGEAYSLIETPLTDVGAAVTGADPAVLTKHLTATWKSANFKSADSASSSETDIVYSYLDGNNIVTVG